MLTNGQRYRDLKARVPLEVKRPARHGVDVVQRAAQRVMGKYYFRLFPGWHRRNVGDFWDTIGDEQLAFLQEQGLKPDHSFLDIGCGSLRAGRRFIDYLDAGQYHGVDKEHGMILAAQVELERAGLVDKRPVLAESKHFDLEQLGRTFDFILAQSVFTHITLNDVITCLVAVDKALAPGGKFFATFYEAPDRTFRGEIAHNVRGGGTLVSYADEDPFHYDVETLRWICEPLSIDVTVIGDWNHPREQRMLLFARPGEAASG
jgi:SAM-dependent methyltransferase